MTTPVNPLQPQTVITSQHTLQALIELTYIQGANDILYNHMTSLNSALQTTQQATDVLTGLQNIHNLVRVVPKGSFQFDYASAYKNYEAAYQHQASQFFGKPVSITAGSGYIFQSVAGSFRISTMANFSTISKEILQYKTVLSTQIIPALSATTPKTSTGAISPNSMLANLIKVLQDLNTYHVSSRIGLEQWLVDNYNGVIRSVTYVTGTRDDGSQGTSAAWVFTSFNANLAGSIQQNITNAMTSAQSLNTVQTESVRNYLYMFEEYYKSASSMLQQITQIIKNMAQNAG